MLAGPPPRVGISEIRTYRCWSELPNPVPPYSAHPDVIRDAALACPKTCALCCMTSAYNCRNAECESQPNFCTYTNFLTVPRLNCATIVPAQCRDQRWRTIIAQDCPSACGFCNLGGCVDAVADCANDPSICNSIGMQVFVNQNCQRTCSRCPSSTSARISSSTTSITSTCSSYNPDSSSSCAAWAANGFCTNTHYTVARRKATCATTCRIC